MHTHLTEDDLVLHYYGDMTAAEETRATAHLADCATCQGSYRHLQQVLAIVDETAFTIPELPTHFERTVWARLEPALRREPRGWRAWFVLSPARLGWATALVLLVTASFFAGRLLPRENVSLPSAPSADATIVRDRILLIDLSDHLDRSQMVLLELASSEGDDDADFADERARAEQLLAANRLYRQTALGSSNANIAQFLDDLELVLVDLAAAPDHVSAQELDEMRRRIESKGLLFKVRLLSSEVRARQKSTYETRGNQRS